jgi:excisionase family DNA binding protein
MTPEDRVRAAVEELTAAIMAAATAPKVDPNAPDRLYGIPETAGILSVGRSAIYTELQSGRLRGIKVGRRRLVSSGELARYIGAQGDGKARP